MKPNIHNHFRGLHIVCINPHTYNIESAQVFDTYETCEHLDNFINKGVPENFIVVAACKDDCTTKLSENAKKWFEKMGSKKIRDLEFRQGFVFMYISMNKENFVTYEKTAKTTK